MMTDEQRYLFDLYGFLHLKNVLTPEELDAASEAANRYIDSTPEDRPPHFEGSKEEKGFSHGFAFDRALERLVFLPDVWPIVLELTNGKPMLVSGTMMLDDPQGHTKAVPLHCARATIMVSRAPATRCATTGSFAMTSRCSPTWTMYIPVMAGCSCSLARTKASSTGRNSSFPTVSSKQIHPLGSSTSRPWPGMY